MITLFQFSLLNVLAPFLAPSFDERLLGRWEKSGSWADISYDFKKYETVHVFDGLGIYDKIGFRVETDTTVVPHRVMFYTTHVYANTTGHGTDYYLGHKDLCIYKFLPENKLRLACSSFKSEKYPEGFDTPDVDGAVTLGLVE